MSRTIRRIKPGKKRKLNLPRAPLFRRKPYVEKDKRKEDPKHKPDPTEEYDGGSYFDNFIDGRG